MTTRNNTRRERVAARRALAAALALTLACFLSPTPSLANDGSALNFDSDTSASIEGNAPISGPVEGFDSVAVEGEEHDFASAENAALDPIPVFAPDEALASGSDGASDPDSVPVESAPDLVDSIPAPRAGANYREVLAQTAAYLSASVPDPGVSSIGGEWAVLGLARSGRDVPGADAYYASVVEYVQKAMDENGRLNRSRSTENSRLILALTAIGKDVTHVAGRSLLDGLDSMAFITKQSVNGPVWALLALDSHGYPTSGDVTREKLVRAILDTQREDGSWPVIASSQVPDVDMTAMAVQALAPYYENAQVKAAVDAALTFLAGVQNDDATFSEIPGTDASAESTAQVIVALTALGIDPTADSRFVKSGVSVVDALCGFYVTGGGFRHLMADKTVDGMATEQGYYALAAYYRLLAQKTSLYDMSDVTVTVTPDQPVTPAKPEKPDTPRTGDESLLVLWMGAAALSGAAVLLMQRKKKRA